MKEDKIHLLIKEAIRLAPDFRKQFSRIKINSESKLTPHQYYSLILIYKHEKLSMGEIADKLGVSNQQITRIMDGLVDLRLVERFVDPTNRRLVQTKINDNGKKVIREYEKALSQNWVTELSVLTIEEIEASIEHLKALNKILEKTAFPRVH